MERNRNPINGQYQASEPSTTDLTDLSHEDRALINTGRALQQADDAHEALQEQQFKDDDGLQQSLVAAASIVGAKPLEQILFDLDMSITSDGTTTQLNRTSSDGNTPLYHMPQSDYSPLQKLSALDDICSSLVKQGPHGVQAAAQLQAAIQQEAGQNVVF